MNARYRSSPHSIRVAAAALAVVTVVMLFDFVAGLGEGAGAAVQSAAMPRIVTLAESPDSDASSATR